MDALDAHQGESDEVREAVHHDFIPLLFFLLLNSDVPEKWHFRVQDIATDFGMDDLPDITSAFEASIIATEFRDEFQQRVSELRSKPPDPGAEQSLN